jgi:hypothetical protein
VSVITLVLLVLATVHSVTVRGIIRLLPPWSFLFPINGAQALLIACCAKIKTQACPLSSIEQCARDCVPQRKAPGSGATAVESFLSVAHSPDRARAVIAHQQ